MKWRELRSPSNLRSVVLAVTLSVFVARCRAGAETTRKDEALIGASGVVHTASGEVLLEDARYATWIDDHRILFARKDHTLAIYDRRTKERRTLGVPAPDIGRDVGIEASWHWSISPDQRWAFVSRSELASMSFKVGTPPERFAEALKVNWSGFVELSGSAVVPYAGSPVGWQGARCLLQLSESYGPLLLVDPLAPLNAIWLLDDAGVLLAVSPDGRRAATFHGNAGQVGFSLLDLAAGTLKPLDLEADSAVKAAFSLDGRWLVNTNISGKLSGPPAFEVRSIDSGAVVHRANLSMSGQVTGIAALNGDFPRFAFLLRSQAATRLFLISIRDTLRVDELAVPPWSGFPLAASRSRAVIAWQAADGRMLLYDADEGRGPIDLSPRVDGAKANAFVAFDRPSWFYRSHLGPGSYSVYWPSQTLKATRPEHLCRSASACLSQGNALLAGSEGYRDAERGALMLEHACRLHDAEACYALARESERVAQQRPNFSRLARNFWLFKKACLCGVRLACKALDEVVPDRTADPRARAISSIAMGCQGICFLHADRSVSCRGAAAPPGEFESIAAGGSHACGLKTGGSVVCWGAGTGPVTNSEQSMEFGQSLAPSDRFSSITAGNEHTCGLLVDGTAKCWGKNKHGQASPPAGVRFQMISAGLEHTCGVTAKGRALCWGAGRSNDRSSERTHHRGQANPPNETFVAVSAGSLHTCGITSGHDVRCWGSNRDWLGKEVDGKATPPPGKFSAVVAGNTHSCALSEGENNGSVVCWGTNSQGQTEAPRGSFKQLDRGCQSACALDAAGGVKCWGLGGVVFNEVARGFD